MKIFFDNASTTKTSDEVYAAMNDINKRIYGNPSSMHNMEWKLKKQSTQHDLILLGV